MEVKTGSNYSNSWRVGESMLFFTDIGKLLLIFGGILVLLGLFFTFGGKIPFLGRLPGDIVIHRENFHFYFPIVTCILTSVILTFIFWIIKILRG